MSTWLLSPTDAATTGADSTERSFLGARQPIGYRNVLRDVKMLRSRTWTVKARAAPLPLDRSGWSAIVAAVYVCVVFAWGGLLGALFAAPLVALLVVVISGVFFVRRVRGAVSLRARLMLVPTTAAGSVLLLPLLMLGGGDPCGDLVRLCSIPMMDPFR